MCAFFKAEALRASMWFAMSLFPSAVLSGDVPNGHSSISLGTNMKIMLCRALILSRLCSMSKEKSVSLSH